MSEGMWKLSLVVLGACASQARLSAPYFAETARVLDPGHVSATAVAGGGATLDGSGVGAGGRVRVGIGGNQEIGIEGSGISLDARAHTCIVADCQPSENTRQSIRGRGALASWKLGFGRSALIAGLGASEHANTGGDMYGDYYGHSVDASLALVGDRPLSGATSLYGGGRATVAVPIGSDNSMDAGNVVGGTLTIGLAADLSRSLRLFTEGGMLLLSAERDRYLPTFGVTAVAGIGMTL
jgi:hypothetical protein